MKMIRKRGMADPQDGHVFAVFTRYVREQKYEKKSARKNGRDDLRVRPSGEMLCIQCMYMYA